MERQKQSRFNESFLRSEQKISSHIIQNIEKFGTISVKDGTLEIKAFPEKKIIRLFKYSTFNYQNYYLLWDSYKQNLKDKYYIMDYLYM